MSHPSAANSLRAVQFREIRDPSDGTVTVQVSALKGKSALYGAFDDMKSAVAWVESLRGAA